MSDLSEKSKMLISLYCAVLFLLVASPMMYRLTDRLTSAVGLETSVDGCPNLAGLVLHALVFGLLVRLLMLLPKPKDE